MSWFSSPETTPRATCPNEIFVRFVANNYKPPAEFLDIGSGSGANSAWLESQGFEATALDPSEKAWADIRMTAEEYLARTPRDFDCILDINTLCHVADPPYIAIHRALKPGGKFFSITPALDTEADFGGKGYTCRSSRWSLRACLDHFSEVDIRPSEYPSRGRQIKSWVIEATR